MAIGAITNEVLVIKTYTLKLVVSLRDHERTLTSITFSQNDRYLYTSGLDNVVFDYDTTNWTK